MESPSASAVTSIRVAQWTTGIVGGSALRAIVADPRLDLVAVYAHSAEKVGRDAGTVAGIAPLGIQVTDDVDALLELAPDLLIYMPQWPNVAELEQILDAGINVITTARLVNGDRYPDDAGARLDAAARRGGVSLYGTGMNPMFVPGLAMNATAMCRSVKSVRILESLDCGLYGGAATWESYGFGKELRHDELVADLKAAEPDYAEVLDVIAAGIGIRLDDVRLEVEYALANEDRDLGYMRIPAGTVAGLDARWTGMFDGADVVEMRTTWKLGSIFGYTQTPEWDLLHGYRIQIEGDPGVRLKLSFMPDDFATFDIGTPTAMPAVNAITQVVAARPGTITTLDLPPVIARHHTQVRPPAPADG